MLNCCRLLCVEHIEEYNKPVLYLVRERDVFVWDTSSNILYDLTSILKIDLCVSQVFEYCTTDLKKFMDRTGKGPSNPLPKELIKVASNLIHPELAAFVLQYYRSALCSVVSGALLSFHLHSHSMQNFMYQLLKGVAHCHKHGVMHRDLKPQNLLVDDSTNTLKIADLGLGRAFSIPIKSYTHEVTITDSRSLLLELPALQ